MLHQNAVGVGPISTRADDYQPDAVRGRPTRHGGINCDAKCTKCTAHGTIATGSMSRVTLLACSDSFEFMVRVRDTLNDVSQIADFIRARVIARRNYCIGVAQDGQML